MNISRIERFRPNLCTQKTFKRVHFTPRRYQRSKTVMYRILVIVKDEKDTPALTRFAYKLFGDHLLQKTRCGKVLAIYPFEIGKRKRKVDVVYSDDDGMTDKIKGMQYYEIHVLERACITSQESDIISSTKRSIFARSKRPKHRSVQDNLFIERYAQEKKLTIEQVEDLLDEIERRKQWTKC